MLCLFALTQAAACSAPVPISAPARSAAATDCPRLDSRLLQLTRSGDPVGFASESGLDLNTSGVRVQVELKEGASLPPDHSVVVEARYGNGLQVRVPVSELCALSNDPAVLMVVAPTRFVPETARP